ncbi:Transcription factor TFIIIB component B [Arachnomyces sp. PD_36]|nr:Transcription factor TFIIIB component B [Arachnomyces sp. PD_36]
MVSFSSSVINKSSKKFAPKAPVRRAGAASRPSAPKKPSVERPASQTPQPSISRTPSAVPTSEGPDSATVTPAETQPTTQNEPTKSNQPTTSKESDVSAPTKESDNPTAAAVPIPIPPPKRKGPTPIVPSAKPRSSPPRPASSGSTSTPKTVITPSSTTSQWKPTAVNKPLEPKPTRIEPSKRRSSATLPTEKSTPQPVVDESTQIRPAKRRKTSEVSTRTDNDDAARLPTPTGTPVTRPSPSQADTTVAPEGSTQPKPKPATKKVQKPTKPRRKQTAEEAAAAVVDGVVGEKKPRARKRRASTPENAESMEITPTVVKMSDLCKDLQTGRKSKREIELRNMDRAEAERKRNGKESRNSVSKESSEDALAKADEERSRAEAESQAGPQMRIVNGEIVLDSSSLQIDRHANAARNAEDMEEVEENPLTRRINAMSFGKRSKSESWDEEMTDLFYRGLRMFGTDFMMISKMFPGRTRRQIKLKFGNEERKDPDRIKDTLLGPRESISLETYSEMTNTVYDDPRVIQQELDEEKKRIEEEHAKEKEAQQELLHNPDGNRANGDATGKVLPSIENDSNGVARKPKKKSAKDRKFGGGTEEVLGSIDDDV